MSMADNSEQVLFNRYREHLNFLMTEGLTYEHQFDEAKTNIKKRYFKKKLEKNSNLAAKLLYKMELLKTYSTENKGDSDSKSTIGPPIEGENQ